MLTEIHLDDESPICRVIRGPSRHMYVTTPAVAAMAILTSLRDTEDAHRGPTDVAGGIGTATWTDMLATHGVAVGRRGAMDLTLALIPAKTRTVRYRPRDSEAYVDVAAMFPPMCIGIATQARRFVRGVMFLADMAKQTQMSVHADVPCLLAFPYGNVYSESGAICWGGVEHSDILSIVDLETAFFTSGFNTDLWYAGSGNLRSLAHATPAGTPMPAPSPVNDWRGTIPNMISRLVQGWL